MDFKQWHFFLWDTRKNEGIDDDSGVINVLTAGAPTEISLYDRFGTALANPLSFTDGKVVFYTAKTVTSVDLSIQTASGHAVFMEDVSASVHRVDIDPARTQQTLVIPMPDDVGGTTVQDSGFDLLANMVLRDIFFQFTSLGADANTTDATLDVGITGSTDYIVAAVPEIATGFKEPLGNNTDSVELVYYATALAQKELGTDTADNGTLIRKNYRTSAAKDLVFQHNVTTGSSVLGYIFLDYIRVPTL